MKVNTSILETHRLHEAFDSDWLNSTLQKIKKKNQQIEISFDDVSDYEEALENGEHFQVACALLHSDELSGDDDALNYAIEVGDCNLILMLLSLNDELINDRYRNNYLSRAMYCNDERVFNLLLLHKNIDIHSELTDDNIIDDDRMDGSILEIKRFFGRVSYNIDHYPLLWLQKNKYHEVHKYLNINWDDTTIGNRPLIVHAYEMKDFKMMDRLVYLGASMNPKLGDYDDDSLLQMAIEDWQKDKVSTHKGLEWFAKYSNFLHENNFGQCDCNLYTWLEYEEDNPHEIVSKYFKFPFCDFIESRNDEKWYDMESKLRKVEEEKYKIFDLMAIKSTSMKCRDSKGFIEVDVFDTLRALKFARLNEYIVGAKLFLFDNFEASISFVTNHRVGINTVGFDLCSYGYNEMAFTLRDIVSGVDDLNEYHAVVKNLIYNQPPKFFTDMEGLAVKNGFSVFDYVESFKLKSLHQFFIAKMFLLFAIDNDKGMGYYEKIFSYKMQELASEYRISFKNSGFPDSVMDNLLSFIFSAQNNNMNVFISKKKGCFRIDLVKTDELRHSKVHCFELLASSIDEAIFEVIEELNCHGAEQVLLGDACENNGVPALFHQEGCDKSYTLTYRV